MTKSKKDALHRAVSIPILGPVNATWDEFGAALREAWNDSTRLANWAMTTLYTHDARRLPEHSKYSDMPLPEIALYPHFTGLAGQPKKGKRTKRQPLDCPLGCSGFHGKSSWEGCAASANSILQAVRKSWYNGGPSARYRALWSHSQVLPTFRYPYPYPVHKDSWKATIDEGRHLLHFGLKGRRWCVELKSGSDFARQNALFRVIASGKFKQAELKLYRQGFREKHYMVKLVAELPKAMAKSGRTMNVFTDPNAFWVWDLDGTHKRIVNADHVHRWIVSHSNFLQRISEDTKHEKRWPREMLRNINKARKLRCEKHDNRIDTWTHQAVSMLVGSLVEKDGEIVPKPGFAARNGVEVLCYDDTIESMMPSYPWFNLRQRLKDRCDEFGILFVRKKDTITNEGE